MSDAPLVSVVMPAFKPKYFREALDSLIAQDYPHIELIICDDRPDDKLEAILQQHYQNLPFSLNYSRNETRLWGFGGVQKGVELASGEFIKMLHDDDVLAPNAISRLVKALQQNPQASLATSRRLRLNELDQRLEDDLFTTSPFAEDHLVNGADLVSFLADNTVNFIGEPSCTLFRRKDVLDWPERSYINLGDKRITWVGDLAFYVKLLRLGDLVYLTEPLASFRVSHEQVSQRGRDKKGIGEQGHADFRQAIRDLGWYRITDDNNQVRVQQLTATGQAGAEQQIDLLQELFDRYNQYQDEHNTINTWLAQRCLNKQQQQWLEHNLQPAEDEQPWLQILLVNTSGRVRTATYTQRSLKAAVPLQLPHQLDVIQQANWEQAIPELNQHLLSGTAPWVLLLPAGYEFTASGLLRALVELSQQPELQAISFDEIYRNTDGTLAAALRPTLALDYLLSFPAGMTQSWLVRRQALQNVGGYNAELADAAQLDVLLKIIAHYGLGAIGHIAEPLVIRPLPELANIEHERLAIEQHLQQRGYPDAQIHAPNPGRYQIRYNHPQQPVLSLLLRTGDNLAALQNCVDGLLGQTSYQQFEILFCPQEDTPADIQHWLAALAEMNEPKLRVLPRCSGGLSELYNQAAVQAIGDYLLFLSPHSSVASPHWLDELLNHAQRGEVGIVGGMLLDSSGKISHAGYILGLEGPVGSPFAGEAMDAAGYMQRLQVDQNLSAVSLDCMLVLKQLFHQLSGFSMDELEDCYLSTDFCLRARDHGLLTVWTPHARLLLDTTASLAPAKASSPQAEDQMYAKWLPQLARDPAYNSNLSLAMPGGYKMAGLQLSWRPLGSLQPQPTILAHPADFQGCGHYRIIQPFAAMQREGLIDGALSSGLMHVTDLERYSPDAIVLQRQIGDERLQAMQRMQQFSRAFKVYELDDYLPNLPLKNQHRKDMPKDIVRSLRRGLGFVDRFVVSTHALAEAFAGLHAQIVVRENRLPLPWWQELQTERRQGRKPRVGWAGGSSHTGDLELIADVVRDLADEVEWVFFGMCPDKLLPYVHEFHAGVPIEEYPAALARLNLDLGLAPLEQNLFNECKSNLRQLEYGACGIPIICTDIRCYQNDLPATRVRNRYRDWVDAIRMHINDLDATARMGDELQAQVRANWMLQGQHLLDWRSAWLG